MRKMKVFLITSALIVGLAPVAGAGNLPEGCTKTRGTIHCTEEGKNKNWTTESSKKGSFSSSHEEETTNTNKGGNAPPGQND
ncbi:MAG: hypothetical protein ACRDH9_05840 [Actinomycetota bacterium]